MEYGQQLSPEEMRNNFTFEQLARMETPGLVSFFFLHFFMHSLLE